MKLINLTMIAAAMLMAVCSQIKAEENMKNVLNEKQQCMAAIACLEAKGDIDGLTAAINAGFDAGLTVSEIKEALSQLYAYTGFPRSLNALGTLQSVVNSRRQQGKACEEGKDADPMAEGYDALKQGTEVQTKLSGKPFTYDFAPATDYYLKAHLFGDIFARNMGLKDDEIRSIPATLAARVGEVEAWRAAKAIAAVFGESFDEGKPVEQMMFPKGDFNSAYAQYFIGNSYLAPLSQGKVPVSNVTFEPRCRNNWHIHHKGIQVLICVGGTGWYQEWGKDARMLKPGDVVEIPEGVKHWHGATKDSWFQHVTFTVAEEGASNEWLEPVTDEEYDKL